MTKLFSYESSTPRAPQPVCFYFSVAVSHSSPRPSPLRARAIQPPHDWRAEIGKETSSRGCPGTSTAITRRAWAEIQLATDTAVPAPGPSPMSASSSSRGRSACTQAGTLLSTSALAYGMTRRASMAKVSESSGSMARAEFSSGFSESLDIRPATA